MEADLALEIDTVLLSNPIPLLISPVTYSLLIPVNSCQILPLTGEIYTGQ